MMCLASAGHSIVLYITSKTRLYCSKELQTATKLFNDVFDISMRQHRVQCSNTASG